MSPAGSSQVARGLRSGQHLLAEELLGRGQARPTGFDGRLRAHRGKTSGDRAQRDRPEGMRCSDPAGSHGGRRGAPRAASPVAGEPGREPVPGLSGCHRGVRRP